MNGQITNLSAGVGANYATVNLQLDPAAEGLPGAMLSLQIPLDEVDQYLPGQQYEVTVTPTTAPTATATPAPAAAPATDPAAPPATP